MKQKLLILREKLVSLVKNEDGASAIEYAIIAGLIAVVIMAGAGLLGTGINDLFRDIANALPGVGGD